MTPLFAATQYGNEPGANESGGMTGFLQATQDALQFSQTQSGFPGIFTLGSVQSQTQVTPSQQVLIFARRKFRSLNASVGTPGADTVLPPSVEEKVSRPAISM